MPRYKANGQWYNIPDDKAEAFEKKYPDASVSYINGDSTYNIPLSKRDAFIKKYPDATLFSNEKAEQQQSKPQEKTAMKHNAPVSATETQEVKIHEPKPTNAEFDIDENPNPPLYKNKADFLEHANREQVASLTMRIDDALNEKIGESQNRYRQERDAAENGGFMSSLIKNIGDMRGGPVASAARHELAENKGLGDINLQSDIAALHSAKNAMTNAQRIINEADHNAQSGTFGKWLNQSFIGGAVRGFGQKLFDARTWDMGMSDLSDNSAMMIALKAFDNGEPLTESQQTMLDAKAVELATNAYFGSYLGKGYKAGSVTAESIPFMLEMCLNPASKIGKGATAMLSRYAARRFGKEVLEKGAGKIAKAATRAATDIAGAATMTGTTGAIRTAADVVDRMNGEILFDTDMEGISAFDGHTEGEDAATAFAKAFASTTIENYSEMVGEYFSPILKGTGKAVSVGLDKIGLGKVNQFINDVSMSDVGRLITDFEQHAKWNGVLGEYAEEVAGGIMNALVVGDQTLDTSETGVFNLENNIDTFLGVALMGGFLSSAKTVGYRTPKYRARKGLENADAAGQALFGDTEWKLYKETLSNASNEEEAIASINDILIAEDSADKKAALLAYVNALQFYNGTMQGEQKRRTEEASSPILLDAETSYDNGYALEEQQEMNDAKNMFDYQKQRLLDNFGYDDISISDLLLFSEGENSLPEDKRQIALDYINAKATYDGMIDRVNDDIDSRINAAHATIDRNTNTDTGMILPATMKTDDRKVYIIGGRVVMNDDGTMVDTEKSEDFIIIKDAETGAIESTDPSSILNIDQEIDPATEKQTVQEQISQQFAELAAAKIDGMLAFNQGDIYNLTDDKGQNFSVQVVPNEDGIIDNGDGTINITMLGEQANGLPVIVPMGKDEIQTMAEATNLARLNEYELAKTAIKAQETQEAIEEQRPIYALNDEITIVLPTGETSRGSITSTANEDGQIEVWTETPINGKKVNLFTAEELDTMVQEYNGTPVSKPTAQPVVEVQETNESAPVSALDRIPVNNAGEQLFEQAPIEDTWEALLELNDGNSEEAKDTAMQMLESAQKEMGKVSKQKPKGGMSVFEIQQRKAAHKSQLGKLQNAVTYWEQVVNFEDARKQAEEAEIKRQRRLRLAEARKAQQKNGRYAKEDARLGDYISFRDYLLRIIANGGLKFKWSDDEHNPSIKGLGSHLGFTDSPTERGKRIWMLSNEDGVRPGEAAEITLQGYAEATGLNSIEETGLDTSDALNELLDVILSHDGSRSMFEEAKALHEDTRHDGYIPQSQEEQQVSSIQLFDPRNMTDDERSHRGQMLNDAPAISVEKGIITRTDDLTARKAAEKWWDENVAEPAFYDTEAGEVEINRNSIESSLAHRYSQMKLDAITSLIEGFENAVYLGTMPDSRERGVMDHYFAYPIDYDGHRCYVFCRAMQDANKNRLYVHEVFVADNINKGDTLQTAASKPHGGISLYKDILANVLDSNLKHESSSGSEMYLTKTPEQERPDLVPTPDNYISESKDTKVSENTSIEEENPSVNEIIEQERQAVDTNPTEAQKEAGNYKKGHIRIGQFDITIENPKGSTRSGVDANGNPWSNTMHNDYGYIRGTEGVDGDHIDVFLAEDMDNWNGRRVYIIDQYNEDGTFDEHKVMLGFNETEDSETAYLNNYDDNWTSSHRLVSSSVNIEDFEKWVESSHRKTKPFSEYKSIKSTSTTLLDDNAAKDDNGYSITPAQYTTKRGKVLDMRLVKFADELSKEQMASAKTLAKDLKGWWDREQGGFMMRDNESAEQLANLITGESDKASEDVQPLSIADTQSAYPSTEEPAAETRTTDGYGSSNKLVSSERYAELKKRMLQKINGQLNMGIDPEILAIGLEMATYHIEAGSRKFVDYAKAMIDDLGDVIRPYLKSFYNGARELPEVEQSGLSQEMTSYDDVRSFDVANFDKPVSDIMATAEQVVAEQEVNKQATEAKKKLTKQRDSKHQENKNLRSATEKDIEDNPVVYYQGRPYRIMTVIREGEQTGAAQFSKPHISTIYLNDGKSVSLDELSVENNEDKKKSDKNSKPQEKKVTLQQEEATTGDLFTELSSDEQSNTQDHDISGRSVPEDGDLGTEEQQKDEQPVGERMAESSDRNSATDNGGSPRVAKQPAESVERKTKVKKNTNNNSIERGVSYSPTTPAARFRANVEAIRLMKALVAEEKPASKSDMETLRQYTGWGGLGSVFNNTYDSEYRELQKLLTPEEMQSAEQSINSAYFTPVNIIDSMWDLAKKLGFNGGKVLEGSAGVGNILASMPKGIKESSDITAVEVDSVTGNILKLLYPDADVHISGFEDVDIQHNSIDLAITNVPFVTGLNVFDKTEKDLSRKFKNIHDFCIAKNVRKLKEGGVGIFITSNGTLDKSKALRQWVVNEGNSDFIGAFRLNNKTFEGTKVTSDIIVIRKRVNGEKSPNAIDVSTTSITRREEYQKDTEWNSKTRMYDPVMATAVMEYNNYFIEHPENMAGEMHFGLDKGETYRPGSVGLYPADNKDQDKMLAKWVKQMRNDGEPAKVAAKEDDVQEHEATTAVKEGQLIVNSKGEICLSQQGKAVPIGANDNKVKGHSKAEVLKDYNALKVALNQTLDYQSKHKSDDDLAALLQDLNEVYDSFVTKYGSLNKNVAISFLRNDVDFPAIAAIEEYAESEDINGKRQVTTSKTDVFKKRMIGYKAEPKPTTAKDGVLVSMNMFGKINLPYIANALGLDEGIVKNEILESGLAFIDPKTGSLEVRYNYLSGNVREKLEYAKSHNTNGEFDKNIEELEKVIPMDIPAHLIDFSLGSDWIDHKLYIDYAKEKFGVNDNFDVACVRGIWQLKSSYIGENNEQNRLAGVTSEKTDRTAYGHQLMLAAMNNVQVTFTKQIKHYEGNTETITDKEASIAANVKIQDMKEDFKEWAKQVVLQDETLAEQIKTKYNNLFNALVPKVIDEQFLPEHFDNSNTAIRLYPHQKKAVIRATTEPLMLAHEVGTGKTFTLLTAAMEMKRLGTAKKPMVVVQNATVAQFVADAKKLYPNSKVLTVSEADRTTEGRAAFYAKIKYNDWDMIIVPQSVFDMIPDSEERKRAFIQEKIDEKVYTIEQAKSSNADKTVIRQLEKELSDLTYEYNTGEKPEKKKRDAKKEALAKENASVRAQKQLDRKTDDVSDFDDMGIDALLVDEAHSYKHLGFETQIKRGVKGVDPSYSKRSAGLYLKLRSIFDRVGRKNVVFATGTPISNTAAEIWTFMKYLMSDDVMREHHIYYFDDFVRNFGEISQNLEFTTSGKFKESTRFAGYMNVPELVRIWASVSDTVLSSEAQDASGKRFEDKLPQIEGGKAQDIFLPQSPSLIGIMNYVKDRLNEFENMSGKEKRENSSIPLTMYGIAQRAAIDPRLVDADAIDEPLSKTNKAIEEIIADLKSTESYRGTCAVFCDNYRRLDTDYDTGQKREAFNLFKEMKRKLVEAGVPENQIVIMESGMNDNKKQKIFNQVNAGEVRVVFGTTQTLGTGVNIQKRLHAVIHMDAPNRPMDYTQRNGRIHRQGNLHKEWGKSVRIIRFGVEDSLDVTAYQRLKTKDAFINTIMNGKMFMANAMEGRTLEEAEEGLFDNAVAQLSGSEYALLVSAMEREIRKLNSQLQQHNQDQVHIERQLRENASRIERNKKYISEFEDSVHKVTSTFPDGKVKVTEVDGVKCRTEEALSETLKEKVSKPIREFLDSKRNDRAFRNKDLKYDISFDGIKVSVNVGVFRTENYDTQKRIFVPQMSTNMEYSCAKLNISDRKVIGNSIKELVSDFMGNIATAKYQKERIASLKTAIDRMEKDNALMTDRRGKPFKYAGDLKEAKAKLEEYQKLMQEEMAAKEEKYANMQATEVNLANVDLDDDSDNIDNNRYRLADDSDIITQNSISESAKEFADKLGVNIHIIENIEDIKDSNENKQKRMRRAKGWYDTEHDEIVIVMPNAQNVADVESTILHEAVGHKGLREIVGKDNFSSFLDKVFSSASKEIRARIVELAKSNNWDFRLATEEYIAQLSEQGFHEREEANFWERVRAAFMDMIRKAKIVLGFRINDTDLRYMLWRSYQMRQSKGAMAEAENIAMQQKLNVGQFSDIPVTEINKSSNEQLLFRDGSSLRERYDRKVRTPNKNRSVKWKENLPYRLKEAYQDSMSALNVLQNMISEETGSPIQSFENAYIAENRISSENKSQAEIYERDSYLPMIQSIQDLVKRGADYEDIKAYVIAKHGLERNPRMAQDKAEEAFARYQEEEPKGEKTLADFINEYRKHDYSGLTSLTGIKHVSDAEIEAERMVSLFESKFDTDNLWAKINAATKETLKKSYDSGMMSKATYEKVRDMYRYYVPLRGWDVDVAANEYEYMTSNRLMLSPALKKAEGRTSLADDPLATIGFMAESSIVQGNRNKMKQKFLNMALNHQSELLSVSKQWYVLNKASGEWEAHNPVIPDDATGDEIAGIIEQHEADMQALKKQKFATTKRAGLNLSMHVTKYEGQEHVVRVMRGGEEFCVYVNGNPRAAQAINGLTNPEFGKDGFMRGATVVKNWMARAFTSWNPAFVVSNLSRDIIWATSAVAVKEDGAYTKQYMKNVGGALLKMKLPMLLKKYQNGTLDNSIEIERYFGEFIHNGGETGFTQLNTVEDFKRDIERAIKDAKGKTSKLKKGWKATFDGIEFMNRAVEDISRFSVYMTSRQMGRDVARSIWDAKEITVNFNKKGSGGLGASYMNFAYLFFNATIQGLANFGKLLYRHPKKMMALLTTFASAGMIVPIVNTMLWSLFGDDDDEQAYWDLPEWVRRNNIVIWNPFSKRGFITIPLPHELRPFYGMGEIAASIMQGKEDAEKGLQKAILGFSGMQPFDLTANGGFNGSAKEKLGNFLVNLSPTIIQPVAQYLNNKDYFGVPIYKDNDWNKLDPEWTKAYKSTAPWLVDGTRWLNEITGGNNVDSGIIDFNPALIEHMFESYLGGTGKTINRMSKTVQMLWDEDLQEWRNVPVISSFYQTADERTTGSQINREYHNAVDEMEDVQHSLRGYKNQVRMGNIEYAEKINELISSEVFKRYSVIHGYNKAIKKASDALKLIDPTQREEVETMIMNLKVEMLDKLEELKKRNDRNKKDNR